MMAGDEATEAATALSVLDDDAFARAVADIAARARAAGLRGFGGDCWAFALAFHEVVCGGVFVGPDAPGREQCALLAGVNVALFEAGVAAVGHGAVLFRDACWDIDGVPKSEEDIEAWGMLEFEEEVYTTLADEAGVDWDEEVAGEAGLYEYDSHAGFVEAVYCDAAEVAKATGLLHEAAMSWLQDARDEASASPASARRP